MDIVRKITQVNGFHAHPEGILLAMLADDDVAVRQEAVDLIMKARAEKLPNIRKFQVPKLNFSARKYSELIPVADLKVEPPLAMKLSQQQLMQLVQKPMATGYSCTTVASERAVQLMTSCSLRLTEPNEQDGMLMNIQKARNRNAGPIVGKRYRFY